ncbi:endoplasmic reticulum-adenine nucleotide transporter 1 [Actinidia rufa]|uniref:ADP/ATP translocase n=1 Tax=Actinidia rufa TaxID=165716 RepID=A0A7J0H1I0_9ERIC|nr:endoplasmic reticulum-adenine nucleotide transporter 1 [Actinidia rufa]
MTTGHCKNPFETSRPPACSESVDPMKCLVALGETGTQDNEDANVFQSDNSDEDINVLLTNEANDDFDDDGHEDLNIGKALHDNPHIPFFMNLVGAEDVVGGRDLYDRCPTWSDVTLEFAKGMIFKDKDAVIRACNWMHSTRAAAVFTMQYVQLEVWRYHKKARYITLNIQIEDLLWFLGKKDNFVASFLGWSVTTVSGVCAYPFDTLRRRMMLTSGQPLKYRNAMHALWEIIHLEGFSALYHGVAANMLCDVAGAGVLAGCGQLY